MLKELALIVTLLTLFADARPPRYVDLEDDFMQQQLNDPVEMSKEVDIRGPSHNSRLSANLKGKVALVCINYNPCTCILIYLGAERLTIAGGVSMNELLFFHDAIYSIVPCIATYSGLGTLPIQCVSINDVAFSIAPYNAYLFLAAMDTIMNNVACKYQ